MLYSLALANDRQPFGFENQAALANSDCSQFDGRGFNFHSLFLPLLAFKLLLHCQDLTNRVLNVGQSFFTRLPLTPTAWDRWTAHGIAFLRLDENDRILHDITLNPSLASRNGLLPHPLRSSTASKAMSAGVTPWMRAA